MTGVPFGPMTGAADPGCPAPARTGVPLGPITSPAAAGVLEGVSVGVPFGPIIVTGAAPPLPTKTGVPLGPIANWVEAPASRVGVPSGPMTVGDEVDIDGKPFDVVDPAGVVAESARLKSVLEGTRGIPFGLVVPGA